MKTTLLVLLCLLFGPSISLGQTIDGFKGFKWGTNFEAMRHKVKFLDKDESEGDDGNSRTSTVWYFTDFSRIGSISDAIISFGFYKGKFCWVKIIVGGPPNARSLLREWSDAYGQPVNSDKRDAANEEYMWPKIGTNSMANLRISLSTSKEGKEQALTVLYYWSISYVGRQQYDREQDGKW